MYVPSSVRAFGSAYKKLKIRTTDGVPRRFYRNLEVKKIRRKYLDKPDDHCTDELLHPNMTACIAKFIANEIGCSINIQGIQPTNHPVCNTVEQLHAFAKISSKLENAEATSIYDMTGCLSSCEKDKFDISLEAESYRTRYGNYDSDVLLRFTIYESSYVEEEEYVIYDLNSFGADVGGFMGLVLGFSLLSIYDKMVECLKKQKFINLAK